MRFYLDPDNAHQGEGINLLKAGGSSAWRDADEGSYAEILASIPKQSSGWNWRWEELWEEYDR
jgi:hypothetical protein